MRWPECEHSVLTQLSENTQKTRSLHTTMLVWSMSLILIIFCRKQIFSWVNKTIWGYQNWSFLRSQRFSLWIRALVSFCYVVMCKSLVFSAFQHKPKPKKSLIAINPTFSANLLLPKNFRTIRKQQRFENWKANIVMKADIWYCGEGC